MTHDHDLPLINVGRLARITLVFLAIASFDIDKQIYRNSLRSSSDQMLLKHKENQVEYEFLKAFSAHHFTR